MFFVSKKDDGSYKVFSMRLEDSVIEQFRIKYCEIVNKEIESQEEEYQESDFDPQIIYIADSTYFSTIEKLSSSENNIKDFAKKFDFTFIKFENSSKKQLIVLRIYQTNKFLTKGKFKALIVTQGILELSKNDTIVVDTSIDCIAFNNRIIIKNVLNFEKIFNISKEHLKSCEVVFDFLKGNTYTITNLDRFQKTCENNPNFMRKITSIKKLGIYSKLTFNQISQFNNENNIGLIIENNTITFPTVYKFINLYNDDNLLSRLTDNKYVSTNKKRLA